MGDELVVVVGAGAGGLMAAGRAAEMGAQVLVLEKNDRPGKKLIISGKKRCNLTNARELEAFIAMYGSAGPFMRSVFSQYFRDDLLSFLGRYGVATKTERGGRVFPQSDDARDVVAAFHRYLSDHGVRIETGVRATALVAAAGSIAGVQAGSRTQPARAVILATGGASFPGTGSSGDGYRMAAAVGHSITRVRPALVPLEVVEKERARSMQGVTLRNVRLTSYHCTANQIDPLMPVAGDAGRGLSGRRPRPPVIESRMGEMMMTHFGLGGPVTLQMSLAVVDALDLGPVSVAIDLKPALSVQDLRDRLQRDFDQYGKRGYRTILKGLLPQKLIQPYVDMTGIPADKPAHQISAPEREKLLRLLKSLPFNIKAPLPLASAMVTAGGVHLKEVDPRTMGSRLIAGLYFCGEVIDIDADTGGYNLQAAFSTGFVAGENAAKFARVSA